MKLKIPNSEIQELLAGAKNTYPKYATQIMNLANQNAQGTRASVVGQMSDLIQEFEGTTLEDWEKWYLEGHPNAIDSATDKIWKMVDLLKQSIQLIDKPLVKKWVEELVLVKTFAGLKFQEAILKKVSQNLNIPYTLAEPEDESKGIDGYIGEEPASIKPITYKVKMGLNEIITASIIYYDKRKSDIEIEFEPSDFEK